MHRVTGDHAGAKKSFSVDPVDRDQIDIMDIHSAWYFVAELVPMGIYCYILKLQHYLKRVRRPDENLSRFMRGHTPLMAIWSPSSDLSEYTVRPI